MEIEHFDITLSPDSERPRVAEFRSKQGALAVHCSRTDGSLWLFATGPSGGDRGRLVFARRRFADVLAWASAPAELLTGGGYYMVLRDGRLVVGRFGVSRVLRIEFDEEARDELLLCLRQWATAVRASERAS